MIIPGEGHKNITQKQQNDSAVDRADPKHQKPQKIGKNCQDPSMSTAATAAALRRVNLVM